MTGTNRLNSWFWLLLMLLVFPTSAVWAEPGGDYVGSDACRECHPDQYKSFKANSKKAGSYKHVKVMRKGLTDDEFKACLECHTTGYGHPGGFVSEEITPLMAEAGCEVCHGPGGNHVQSGEPDDIKADITTRDCEGCHNPERVEAFNFKPLIYGGAH